MASYLAHHSFILGFPNYELRLLGNSIIRIVVSALLALIADLTVLTYSTLNVSLHWNRVRWLTHHSL